MESFPPYEMLDPWVARATGETKKLERLYHNTRSYAWDPRDVLAELEKKHGGIQLSPEKREAIGHVFTVLLWGELAAWNIATELARSLPDLDARMAATGQAFDEARHFTVLRDYLTRAGVNIPPMNPYGRRVLKKILETDSMLQKLYGMQLTVENLALALFKRLAASNVEPVLTDLLEYIERDESRHVAFGVIYVPKLLSKSTAIERAKNWAFNIELFGYTVAGGQWMDPHMETLGVDHRELGLSVMKLHQQVIRQMAEELGLDSGKQVRGVYGLTTKQHMMLVDALHPKDKVMSARHRIALGAFDRAIRHTATWLS
jgi:ribonucleotide reductase beta subunit family protein with ferritin-like domain